MRVKKGTLPPEHCASVREYEKSSHCRLKSQTLLDDKDAKCEICGRPRWTYQPRNKVWKKKRFTVHHSTYANCPNEKTEELHILCALCHSTSHDLLRYANIGEMFKRLAEIVKTYFKYDGFDTFKPW